MGEGAFHLIFCLVYVAKDVLRQPLERLGNH